MTQRKFSMKRMALKSKFGFTKINHNYTEEERQVGKYCHQLKKYQHLQVLDSYHSLEYLPPHSKVSK